MGYYTDYEMVPARHRCECSYETYRTIEEFIEATKVDGWSYLSDVWCGKGAGLTWYEHQRDMIKLSVAFPDVLFTLWGCGDESDDLWKQYFLGGKCQVAEAIITYPDFDEGKLKDISSICPSCSGEGVLHADGYPSIGCSRCDGSGEVIE